ncbi:2'-5'-oligoadenylate synthase-like protein isoform X1 [Lemur catta]|uniref:2'-5'-oligoadenylate synthase-like protein isoform X1 n=1 Tax=Lemur catta TaxID=9447 RepID=UPI001E269027|nr:2'-5'-oligoadenylate synthase-like protein isoform X1 [Lemur catta]
MAGTQELFDTPASSLNSFVSQWLQPCRDWKEEVQEVVRTVQQFLRQEHFQGEHGLDQEVRVLKVVQVGSFGNGTVLRGTREVELVVFLSCFRSFQEEVKYHRDVLRLLREKVWCSQDLLALGLKKPRVAQGVPDTLVFTIQTKQTLEPITVTIWPAYRALGSSVLNSELPPEVYVSLIEACGDPGNFFPSFSELQKNFVKYQPTKLKSLLRLVKHWYQKYVKTSCPRAKLPPVYALELLTIYAWEMGTQKDKNFMLDEGLATVMELLRAYEHICIYWTTYYTFQNPVIKDFLRKQFQKPRPIILDPADPTHNVAEGYRWDIVAQRAAQCLKQDCCFENRETPVPTWNIKRARDIQVTVEQWGCPDRTLLVNPYESIKTIKEKMQRGPAYPGQQRLSFQEPGSDRQLLRSGSCLADYGIFFNIRIYRLQTVSTEMQVFVKKPDGGSHAYAIQPNSFVWALKQQIECRQGLPEKQQLLQFQGEVLHDWWGLGCYGIQDSDTLVLSVKAQFPAN